MKRQFQNFANWFNQYRLFQHVLFGLFAIRLLLGVLFHNDIITNSELIAGFIMFCLGGFLAGWLTGYGIEEFQKWQRKSSKPLNKKSMLFTAFGGTLGAALFWFTLSELWLTILSGILLILLTVYYFIDEKFRTQK